MRAYFTQLRQETGIRICDKVFDPETDKPTKVQETNLYLNIGPWEIWMEVK